MNNVSLVGRLTADPEPKETANGHRFATFSLAVRRPGAKDETDFIPCVAWRQTAEFLVQYFSKGQALGLTGRLASRRYEDKEGKTRTAYEVVADRLEFVEAKRARDVEIAPEPSAEPFSGMAGASGEDFTPLPGDEDLPF